MINIFVNRKYLKEKYTIGQFFLGKKYYCDTLEDKVRDYNKDGDLDDAGETKIYGETAIPYGRYHVEIHYSPKFKRMIPFVYNVKHFKYIRIHALNWPGETLGCIGVGENKVKGGLIHSRYWENKITQELHAYQKLGEKIYINII